MLYKKKIIRDFLSLFTENYWKQLISCILEYGIINFKKHHNIASLIPEEIIAIVESLKKEENLVDKKKSNIIIKNQFANPNTKISNKLNSSKNNVSRSRSKSNSSNKDSNKLLKNNALSLLNSMNKNKNLEYNSNSNNTSFLGNKNKNLKTSNISGNDKINTGNTLLRPVTSITSISNTTVNKKLRTSQTPSRESNLNSFKAIQNKKIKDKSDSSQSVSRGKNKIGSGNPSKNLISSGKKSKLNKNTFVDSENEGIKSSRLNRENTGKGVNTNLKSSSSFTNINSNASQTAANQKKKKPTEILEQAHLNKLKEKKKILKLGQESSTCNLTDDDKTNSNFNTGIRKISMNSNENLTTQNQNVNSNTTSTTGSTGAKFNKVQSRIKNVIENDKKIYNMLKNNQNKNTESHHIQNSERDRNFNSSNSNIKIEDSETGNKNFSPKSTEKFIGDGNYLHKTNYSSTGISNNAKSSILSLEEKLNGLTQKISKVEKSSNFMAKYK